MTLMKCSHSAAGQDDQTGAGAAVAEHLVETALLVGADVGGREKVDAEVAIALRVRERGGGDRVTVKVVLLDHGVLMLLGDLLDFGGLGSVSVIIRVM